jgi:hypothetical protein
MGAIAAYSSNSWYGNTGWSVHQGLTLGDSSYDYKGRCQIPSLSGGKSITSLTLNFYRYNTGTGGNTFVLYATQDSGIVGNSITSARLLGTYGHATGTGWKTISLSADAMAVLSGYTSDWYLLMDANASDYLYGYSTNGLYFSGTYSDGSIWTNVGGVWHKGEIWTNVGGVWHKGTQWSNVAGVWKKGL